MSNHRKVAVITGATGGLGASFIHNVAKLGYDLIISGRQEHKLASIASVISEKYRVNVEVIKADFSTQNGIEVLTNRIQELNRVDMLISNAGYGEGNMFEDESVEDVLKMIRVHVDTTVQLVHAVLPFMRKQQGGNIIVVSSLSAFVPAPGSSIYSATKNFLNTFMESVQMEVRGHGIHVQSLCPGLTHTNFHAQNFIKGGVQLKKGGLWMRADDVVRSSLRNLNRRKVVHVPGLKNKIIKFLTALIPRRSYLAITERITIKVRMPQQLHATHSGTRSKLV